MWHTNEQTQNQRNYFVSITFLVAFFTEVLIVSVQCLRLNECVESLFLQSTGTNMKQQQCRNLHNLCNLFPQSVNDHRIPKKRENKAHHTPICLVGSKRAYDQRDVKISVISGAFVPTLRTNEQELF